MLQVADGSWLLDDALAKALGWRTARQAEKALKRTLASDLDRRAAGTALALAWLEREAPDSRDEWRLLADKARQWLARMPADWITSATEALDRR